MSIRHITSLISISIKSKEKRLISCSRHFDIDFGADLIKIPNPVSREY